ncbi:hypothetical protein FJZ39_00625 [Candidatus Saccharibacteria bacterium]|nr:hypothetical protein [Candidatus Saccharibacteria bacterium]
MASTKKSAVKAKSAPKATKTAETKVRTISAAEATKSPKRTAVSHTTVAKPVTEPAEESVRTSNATTSKLPNNMIYVVLAELLGTFVLTSVLLYAAGILSPLYAGLTVAAIYLGINYVSGAHVNPAVTFGLWAMRRLPSIALPFYWIAQFLGAMAAVVVINLLSNGQLALSYGNFADISWPILFAELFAMAVFMFGIAAVTSRRDISNAGKGLGVGLAYMAGILVGGALLYQVQAGVDQSQITSIEEYPHELRVKDVTANPAVALAASEKTDAEIQGAGAAASGEERDSRLGLETILGTLLGAALGGNLYLLVSRKARQTPDSEVAPVRPVL